MSDHMTIHQSAKLIFAFKSAMAFLQAAENSYWVMNSRMQAAQKDPSFRWIDDPGQLAPLVSNVAFSVELLLKARLLQESDKTRRGHDLTALYKKLNDDTKVSLNTRYLDYVVQWNAGPVRLRVVEAAPRQHTDVTSEFPASIELGFRSINGSFEKWRYMFELPNIQYLRFDFATAYIIAACLRDDIEAFRGSMMVTMQ